MTPVLAAAAIRALAAIADRIFPADEETPGGADLGVVDYVLAQLAGAWGSGERTYRARPFARPPHSGHGWQSELTPLEAFRRGLAALDEHAARAHGTVFADLPACTQDALLADLERGAVPGFGEPGATAFFDLLLSACLEGVFADPRHGGNRGGAAWAWIGFPGPRVGGFPAAADGESVAPPPGSSAAALAARERTDG